MLTYVVLAHLLGLVAALLVVATLALRPGGDR